MTPHLSSIRRDRLRIQEIGRRYGISDVRIFGSVARGEAHEGSDVDMLVRIEAGRTLLDIIGFEQEVAQLLGIRVEVVTERALHPLLAPVIHKEAMAL